MKLPKSIWVKGTEYTIKRVKDFEHDGDTDREEKIIRIDAGLRGKALRTTVLHEIGHAIETETSINQAVDENVFEMITDNFANVLDELFYLRFK